MILIAELINHFVNGIVNMATVKKTIKKAQEGKKIDKSGAKSVLMERYKLKKSIADNYDLFNKGRWESPEQKASNIKKLNESAKKDSLTATKLKSGGMLKRADGSYSKRGLWDNIRANKGSGKKPTAAMLKQEKKIKAKTKK